MSDKDDALKRITLLMESAEKLAVDLIEQEARRILANDPDLYEYVQAMGSGFFVAKKGGKYDPDIYTDEEFDEYMLYGEGQIADSDSLIMNDLEDFNPNFSKMIDNLIDKFGMSICGVPMRFTANSKIVREWGDTRKDPVVYEERNLTRKVER